MAFPNTVGDLASSSFPQRSSVTHRRIRQRPSLSQCLNTGQEPDFSSISLHFADAYRLVKGIPNTPGHTVVAGAKVEPGQVVTQLTAITQLLEKFVELPVIRMH